MSVERMATVLAEHRLTWRTQTMTVCTCGHWGRADNAGGKLDAPVRREHDIHVATVLHEATKGRAGGGGMSADLLRDAVKDIRDHWDGEGYREWSDFMLAVAAWLDATADTSGCDCGVNEEAVARAYLGRDS